MHVAGEVPATRGNCGKMNGALLGGTEILASPPCADAVTIWPSFPVSGHFVAVGSHVDRDENHTTGFSWGSMRAVLGLISPELMIERSFSTVV